jgi:type VI secretion system protein ImpA
LRQAPLCISVRMGRVTLADVLDAEDPSKQALEPPAEEGAPENAKKKLGSSQISAAFRDSDQAALKDTHTVIGEIVDTVGAINTFLTETVGAGRGVTFDELSKALKKMQGVLSPYLGGQEVAAGADGEVAMAANGGNGGGVGDGRIRSRDDVVFMLDQICDFYSRSEPSSPVPLLLKRAQRLAKMSFFEIINDLTPDSISQLKVIAGKDPNEVVQE